MPLPKGFKHSEDTKKKMSNSHKGIIPKNINQIAGWNKDKDCKKYNWGRKKGFKMSDEHKKKISLKLKGRKLPKRSIEHSKKISKSLTGRKQSEETRIKKGLALKGDKSHFWKGGCSKKNRNARYSIKYKLWREKVFKRDNYICQDCGVRGGYLEAHHIKSWANYPKLRYIINNGITYCLKCHKKNDTQRR